jgi:hypothetical protein
VCLGIALAGSDVPTEMVGRCGLARHHHLRGGKQPEYRFLYRERRPRLPVIRDGHLFFARWGNGRGQSRRLPRTGWTWLTTIREGWWKGTGVVPVDIPASYGFEGRGALPSVLVLRQTTIWRHPSRNLIAGWLIVRFLSIS